VRICFGEKLLRERKERESAQRVGGGGGGGGGGGEEEGGKALQFFFKEPRTMLNLERGKESKGKDHRYNIIAGKQKRRQGKKKGRASNVGFPDNWGGGNCWS